MLLAKNFKKCVLTITLLLWAPVLFLLLLPTECGAIYTPFNLPKDLTVIGDSAFEGLPGRDQLIIPDQVVRIGSRAFAGVEIRSVVFPKHALPYNAVQEDSFDWDGMERIFV